MGVVQRKWAWTENIRTCFVCNYHNTPPPFSKKPRSTLEEATKQVPFALAVEIIIAIISRMEELCFSMQYFYVYWKFA